ncbi:YfhO family protein, partial [Ruminococcaceae bacterium OttesenSCG-928-A16]|nr:YfhO family protein [Ruminococcaceae bacterium OttesenSCG-928-A16]
MKPLSTALGKKSWQTKFFLICICITVLFLAAFIPQSSLLFTPSITTPSVNGSQHFAVMTSNTTIKQNFTCPQMSLEKIILSTITYGRQNQSKFTLALRTVDGTLIEQETIDASTLGDNETFIWHLTSPINISKQQQLSLYITTTDVLLGNEIAFFWNPLGTQTGSSLSLNEERLEYGTLAFSAEGTYTNFSAIITFFCIVACFALTGISVFLWCLHCDKRRKINPILTLLRGTNQPFTPRQQHIMYIGLLVVMALAIYWQYLLGLRYFIFRDSGNDSYVQTFPVLLNTAQTFWQGGSFPHYNNLAQLGNPQGWTDPFNALLAMFGANSVAYMLGVFQFLKVILAGVFFYAFTRKAKFCYTTSILCGLGYAFCGPMMLHSSWSSYPNEIVVVAFLLLAIEFLLQDNNWLLLPLGFVLYIFCCDILRVAVYFLIFFAYVAFRYLVDANPFKLKPFILLLGKTFLLLTSGILLAMVIVAPSVNTLFTSSRVQSSLSSGITAVPFFSDYQTISDAILRLFSNELLGSGKTIPTKSYLDGPAFYIGLINLVMVPQLFVRTSSKQRILYSIPLFLIVSYVSIASFRFLMNGFSRDTFKITSFWVVVILFFLAACAWDRFFREKILSVPLLVITMQVVSALLFIFSANRTIQLFSGILVLLTLLFGIILLTKYQKRPSKTLKLFLIALLSAELLLGGYSTQNNRTTVGPASINTIVDDHSTAQLVNNLQASPGDYFRISYPKSEFCASLAQGYMSTTSYLGGSGLSTGYKNLLFHLAGEAPSKISDNPYFTVGYDSMRSVNTLFGVEYMFLKKDQGYSSYVPYGYTP